MINTVITVYTKTGNEYGFEDSVNPGAGTSALTQFTSGQDIHAQGLIISSQTNAELYIPYVAIDHIIVLRQNLSGGPKDEVCGIDPCEDTPFSARDNTPDSDPISLPANITLEEDPLGSSRYLYVWCGTVDKTDTMELISWSSDAPGVQFYENYEIVEDVRSVAIEFPSTGTWNITVRAANGCEITFPVTVS